MLVKHTENAKSANFGNLNFLIFWWVELLMKISGRVRRQRDVEKWNMLGRIRSEYDGYICDGKVQNITGNALVPDFATCFTRI